MRIAIISAMYKEIEPILKKITFTDNIKYKNFVFQKGFINNNEVCVTSGGIGKVNSGIITTIMDKVFPNIDLLINVGISGGIFHNVNRGDIVISEKLSYSDVDTTAFGEEYGQIPDMPRFYYGDRKTIDKIKNMGKVGLVLTGDAFIDDKKKIDDLVNKHFSEEKPLCVDMESTAFAQAAYLLDIPFVSIRCISDVVGDDDQIEAYENFNRIACEKVCKAIEKILND